MSKHRSCCCMNDDEKNKKPIMAHSNEPDCRYCIEDGSAIPISAVIPNVIKKDIKTSCISCECSTPTCASCFVFKPRQAQKEKDKKDKDDKFS